MASSHNQTTRLSSQQAKLILQDPRILDEAPVPLLRLSQELVAGAESGVDRQVLQKTWEALQLKPEEVISQSIQLRDVNAKAETAMQQASSARAELVQVQTKLQELQDTRWQHPVMYTAGAAILGLGCLWFFERRKRIAAQEHTELLLSESHSVLERPEGPPSDAHSFDDPAFLRAKSIIQPKPEHEPNEHVAGNQDFFTSIPTVAPTKTAFEVAPPWWSRKRRPGNVAKQAPSPVMQSIPPSADPHVDIQLYEDSTEIEDMQAPIVDLYNPAISLESTESTGTTTSTDQVEPEAASVVSSKDAMTYLLEIRMTVQTFYALEQPHSAHQLLEQHIEAVPNTCAWAYMEYLDISSKLGLRDAFEAMRTRYRLQFNRLAPYWKEPNASVQHLDSYERPMSELCAAWPSQDRSKALMATWLLGNLHSRRLFQLPAYHDLLDLYEMLEFYDHALIEAQDFVPTVSLLELDYEFAVEVKLDAESANDALRAIPTVKPGDFAVDFNLAHNTTQQGALEPIKYTP
jgi:hypothetical protein